MSVKSHLTSGASVRHENAAMYSAGNEGQNICGVLKGSLPLMAIPAIFPADNTHAHCVRTQGARCDARAPCRKLSLCSISFTIIILELESSRLVYLAGYGFALGVSETAI